MFLLLKTAIWITGAFVVGNFLLNFAHYQMNWSYILESRDRCFSTLSKCQGDVIRQGTENATCHLACFETGKLIEKQKD